MTRDSSSCQATRQAAGLSGFWLKFSFRITLTVSGTNVIASFDSRPDHTSLYFDEDDACYDNFSASGRFKNPNYISAQSITMTIPRNPSGAATAQGGGAQGLALNGVSIFSNQAAPGDSIYQEIYSFDRCEGHPQNTGNFHYHTEPPSISNHDYGFIGVMRDGYPVYGVKDSTGATPLDLDSYGGHNSVTSDSNGASVYHYHVNLQTEGSDSAYFLTKGSFKASPGSCIGCN